MAAAKATGRVGPSLDGLRPRQQRVERQVRHGGTGNTVVREQAEPGPRSRRSRAASRHLGRNRTRKPG